MKARSALFTLFGDLVRPAGGEAWLSTLTACMGTLDFRPPAVRTALHRMAGEGWVEPRKDGRYAAYGLTDKGVDRLEEAAVRIYRLRTQEWDGAWRVLLAPDLHDSDVVAELGWIGYGEVQDGVWALPHRHPDTARDLVDRSGCGATWLDGAGVSDDTRFAEAAWPLDELRAAHLAFLEEWADVDVPDQPADCMGSRLRLVHHWRSFLFLDPGLPAQVLGPDWPGIRAAEVFASTYARLVGPSWAFYVGLQQAVAAEGPDMTVVEQHNPFARGLSVMQRA